jgi:two-component system, cell cycle sensor histidine kinase and response regulator CckA
MTVRFKPLAEWSPIWSVAATGAGAAGLAALALAGQGQTALALLATGGAASGALFAAGKLRLSWGVSQIDERLLPVLAALPSAAAVTSRKGKVLWKSDALGKLLGSSDAAKDMARLGEAHPETAAAVFRLLQAAAAGSPSEESVTLPQIAGGAAISLSVWPYRNRASRVEYLVWQIGEVKSAAGSESYGNSIGDLPVPALSIAKDLTVLAASASFEKLYGKSPIGVEACALFKTKRGKPFTRAWLRDVISKAGEPTAVQIASEDGTARSALLHFAGKGDPFLCLAIPTAVSGSLDEPFEALLSRAPQPMALTSAKGVVLALNDAFRALFSGDAGESAEICGKPLAQLVADTSSQTVRDRIASLAGQGAMRSGAAELQAALKGAEGRNIRLVLFPSANGSNLIVTAIQDGAAALGGEEAMQGQKLQAVGELAGGIAHDFNNLLTAIIGYSDLLLRRFRASDPAFKDVMNIKGSATRAAELVKRILAYSRRQTLRPAILRLTDVIEEFQATMGRTLGEKVRATVQHGRDLWFVKADEGQLFQVVMNLAVNARDAMPNGGEIAIRTANVGERESMALKDRGVARGEYVLCEVRDTGTGIKPEHLEKIFDPFFSTKEVGKGTGLGLSMVYGIVKQTGGALLVDSKIGVGTTFRIYLPRYVETAEDLKELESKPDTPEKTADLTGSATILLVEDEEAVRSFAVRALSTRGYKVLEAGTGVEALEVMEREKGKIDLVVSDVVMPEMDGPTMLRHLRERNPHIRIVFMSGYAEEAFRKNLGPDENFVFLPKPFTLKKLAETVKAAAA